MSDWYDEAKQALLVNIAENMNISLCTLEELWDYLSDIGIIDYDATKEVLSELYE